MFFVCILFSITISCDDELDDELFTRYTYLLDNGWIDSYSLLVEDDNTAILPLDFGISGTSMNNKEVSIKVAVDPDLLLAYNEERYKGLTERYFQELPHNSYTFDKEDKTYIISKGIENVRGEVKIDLNKLRAINIFDEYVLPLRIVESEGEIIGPDDYATVLAKISFKNILSGDLAGNGTIKYRRNNKDYTETVNGRSFQAIGKKQSYFYVGDVTRQSENAAKYILILTLDDEENVTLSALNEALDFIPIANKLKRTYREKNNDNRYYIQTSVLDIKYTYKDPYDGENEDITYTFEASLSKTEDVLREDYPDVEIIVD